MSLNVAKLRPGSIASRLAVLSKVAQFSIKDGYCYATNLRLTQELGLCRRTVQYRIQALELMGMIIVKTEEHSGQMQRHIYLTIAGVHKLKTEGSWGCTDVLDGCTVIEGQGAQMSWSGAQSPTIKYSNTSEIVKEPEETQTDGHDDSNERSGGPERGEERESISTLYAGDMQPHKGPDYGETQDDVWWDTGTSETGSLEDSGEPGGFSESGGSAGAVQKEPGTNGQLRETAPIETQEESRRLMHEWLQAKRAGLAA